MRIDGLAVVTIGGGSPDGWLSPTRVWRLTECPASVAPVAHGLIHQQALQSVNSGTLAHDAVHLWIERDGHKEPDPRAAMKAAIDQAIAAHGGATPPDWTMNRARLLARTPELAAILTAQPDAAVRSERLLIDTPRQLRGTPDIVVLGGTTLLIDLKTETLAAGEVPPWVRFQLTIYAHLVEDHYRSKPDKIEIFSLNRGRIPVLISEADISRALESVDRARAADPTTTRPDREVCRFCRRRLFCQPQWDAAAAWIEPDCLEGTVEHVERAVNGLASIRLRCGGGEQWVGGIPAALTNVAVGTDIRFVRIFRRQNVDADFDQWRWTSVSSLAAL